MTEPAVVYQEDSGEHEQHNFLYQYNVIYIPDISFYIRSCKLIINYQAVAQNRLSRIKRCE